MTTDGVIGYMPRLSDEAILALCAENARLRECVSYYADREHHGVIIHTNSVYVNFSHIPRGDEGQRARECLAEIGERK